MTITVVRRRRKETKFKQAISNARRIGAKKSAAFLKVLQELDKKEDRLKATAIRRWAKRKNVKLMYFRKPWIQFLNVSMPAGYFAVVDNVVHRIVAE